MRKLLVILAAVLSISCDSSKSRVASNKIVLENLHLGEYLQPWSPSSVITVDRSPNGGLARVDLGSEKLEILDSTAVNARDVFLSNESIAYRINKSIRVWFKGKIIEFPANAERLRYFAAEDEIFTFIWDADDKSTRWRRINSGLTILGEGLLHGSPRSHLIWDGDLILALQTSTGLEICRWKNDQCTKWMQIEKGIVGSYARFKELNGQWYLAYFDETLGVLKMATMTSEGLKIETVDGEPFKTYRGMDIAIFRGLNGNPGLLYLDAWTLKLRMAQKTSSGWSSEVLPFDGALGFYTQVLEESDRRIRIAFHSFRTDHPDRRQSFENLMVADIKL